MPVVHVKKTRNLGIPHPACLYLDHRKAVLPKTLLDVCGLILPNLTANLTLFIEGFELPSGGLLRESSHAVYRMMSTRVQRRTSCMFHGNIATMSNPDQSCAQNSRWTIFIRNAVHSKIINVLFIS